MRKALGTLRCVEQGSIQTDVDKREVRFNLKKDEPFDMEKVKEALKGQGFSKVTLESGPKEVSGDTK